MTVERPETVARERQERIAELYAVHAPDAARLAYLLTGNKQLAEDVVQDAFVKILGRFRDRGSVESFKAYLRATVINVARGHFRRLRVERNWQQRQRGWLDDVVTKQPDVETRDEMWSRLQTLPYRQRAALVLRYYEDLSENETADVMQCSPGAVKSLTSRAMSTLRGEQGAR
ncbi:MAG: RNA polymerase sigma factor [Actinomycetota bacterium]